MSSKLEKIRELNRAAWALCKKDGPGALELSREAQRLLAESDEADPRDEFDCLKCQAYCLDMLGKPDEALPLGMRAYQLAEHSGDKYLMGSIQSILGRIHWHIDDFPTALDYYLNALKLIQTENHPDLEISLINGLGLVKYGMENYKEALGYFKTCLEKAAEDDLTGRGDASNNIAYTLHMLGRDQEALPYGLAALELFNKLATAIGKMETLQSLGAIHFALGNYSDAMDYLREGLALSRRNDSPILEISYVFEMSRIAQGRGDLTEAENDLLQALQTAQRINSRTNTSLIHERLVEIYKLKGEYRSALEHSEAFHAANKSIFNEKSDRRVKNLEVLHKVELTRKEADLYRELAGTDFLTSLLNRRRFMEIAEITFERLKTQPTSLSFMMMDIDHFKNVNDQYGHKIGDEVLAAVAASIKNSLREGDIAARYGGEEFIVMVVGANPGQSYKVAERIRLAAGLIAIQADQMLVTVTLSLGYICVDPQNPLPLDALITCADQALYKAKELGRNRVVSWTKDLGPLDSPTTQP